MWVINMENRIDLKDGLIKQNMVFMSGMLTAPIIACTTTLGKSLAVCFVFSFVSFFSILLCRFIPRTIVYTIRITLYSIAAAVFYIPAILLAEAIFGMRVIESAGVYLPVLITNALILSKTETRFYLEPAGRMTIDVIGFMVGFDISCTATGIFRELLATGRIGGAEVPVLFTVPAMETTFGGFLFVGIGAGLFRAVYNYRKKRKEEPEEEDSLAEYAEDVGEFLVGKHNRAEKEKIRIYRSAVKKTKNVNELLDMEFLSNRDVLEAFEAIIAEGQEMGAESAPAEQPPEETAENDAAENKSAENENPADSLPAEEAASDNKAEESGNGDIS